MLRIKAVEIILKNPLCEHAGLTSKERFFLQTDYAIAFLNLVLLSVVGSGQYIQSYKDKGNLQRRQLPITSLIKLRLRIKLTRSVTNDCGKTTWCTALGLAGRLKPPS